MTDDLSEAYSENESRITGICEDEATVRSNERFELGMWKVISCLGFLSVAISCCISWKALWATPMFLYPVWSVYHLRKHCAARYVAFQIQLERCFHYREYLKSRMRGF